MHYFVISASKFEWTLDDIRLEKIQKFLEWHEPHKEKKNSGKPVRPLFGPQFCCYCLKYKKKTNKPNLRKCPIKLISAPILVHVTQIWTPKLFS